MEAVLRKTVTVPNVAFFTIAEAWLLTRALPELLPDRAQQLREQSLFVMVLLGLIVINYTTFFLYRVFIYSKFFSPLRTFPAPEARDAHRGWLRSIMSFKPGENFLKWGSEPVNTEGVLLMRSPVGFDALLATGPKALQEILVTNPYDWEKPGRVRNFLRHVLGDGLVIVEGEQHKFQRKHVKPAFGFRQIKDLYPMMWKKAIAITQVISEEIKADRTGSTEIGNWANKVTLDIIGIAGLGREFNVMKNSDDPLVHNYEELLEPTIEKFLYFIARTYGPDRIVTKLPWRLNGIFKKTTTSLRTITRQLVADKREAMKIGADEHFDILSLLIKTGDFSDEDLSDQLLTFLAAGHETTSSAFTWTVFLLATHPEIQRRVREEVRSALPSNPLLAGGAGDGSDLATTLERLPILNGVASETLRLYPTVPITVRRSNRDTTLLGRPIPPNTDVILSPWATNRLPSIWGPDADQFNPDRWINPSDNTPNPSGGVESNYSFLTFLHGPRSCIGQNFARAELRCLIAAFVGRFEWELDMKVEDVIPGGVITIKPRNGLQVKLREVGSWDGAGDAQVLE